MQLHANLQIKSQRPDDLSCRLITIKQQRVAFPLKPQRVRNKIERGTSKIARESTFQQNIRTVLHQQRIITLPRYLHPVSPKEEVQRR
jgi:hypothetical protein